MRRKINTVDQKGKTYRTLKTTVVNEIFAVHGTLYEVEGYAFDGKTSIDRENWTLTHIPTGAAVMLRGESKAKLVRIAKKLMELGDWDSPDYDTIKNRFVPWEVQEIIRTA